MRPVTAYWLRISLAVPTLKKFSGLMSANMMMRTIQV